tara:strand:+ start:496 stop:1158 length:663 start_codon:yes stop_codon:yes gene_type:complete
MKVCTNCKQNKPLSEYYKNKTHIKSGVKYYPHSRCKVCHSNQTSAHHKKPESRRKRLLRQRTPAGREIQRRRNQKWINSGKSKRYKRMKRKTDPSFRLKENLRRRLRYALKGQNKAETTMKLVGCTSEEAVQWIESQFTDGMTWENIEVDHMMPCNSFNLEDPDQQKSCFHYTNLQPLFKKDNRMKSDKITHDMKWTGVEWFIKGTNGLYRSRELKNRSI